MDMAPPFKIPGGVEHGVLGSEGWSLALDIFSPLREGYQRPGAVLEEKYITRKRGKKASAKSSR